jgi:uncharacterized protein (TIGR02996 family)
MDGFIPALEKALKYAADHTHTDFMRKIADDESDRQTPLVYADWLAEQGLHGAEKIVRDAMSESSRLSGTYSTAYSPVSAYTAEHNAAPDYHPAIDLYTTLPDGDEDRYIVRMMARADGDKTYRQRAVGWVQKYSPEDAHSVVSGMDGLPGAARAKAELEGRFPYLKKSEAQ